MAAVPCWARVTVIVSFDTDFAVISMTSALA